MIAASPGARCTESCKRSGLVLNALRAYLSGSQGLGQDYLVTWRLGEAARRLNARWSTLTWRVKDFRRFPRTSPSPFRTLRASQQQPDETSPPVRAGARFLRIWARATTEFYVL
jgi:hypothetical protein